MSISVGGLFAASKPVIGMLHAPPLPGAPRYGGDFAAVKDRVLRDADALAKGGVDGLLLENFGDAPFFPGRVPSATVALMTALAAEVRRAFRELPLGINVLRNDGRSALAVAVAAGAQFIRVNVLCGARVADQGVIQGIAHDLLRDRAALLATAIKIFADVDVKHSAPLAPRPIEAEAEETIQRGGADALVVSGSGTGRATDRQQAHAVRIAARGVPVFIGSGVTAETITAYLDVADGFIVGTSLKHGGIAENTVDVDRVRALRSALETG